MRSQIKTLGLVAVLTATTAYYAIAQCNTFTKKKCLPVLKPFIHNGQLNSVTLSPGESASLMLTFYIDTDYRLAVCGQEVLGDMTYKVMKKDSTLVFDSQQHKNPGFWDFKVNSTQQMIVEVTAPDRKAKGGEGVDDMGCASVLVGFKKD
jgi:hypothetical protein